MSPLLLAISLGFLISAGIVVYLVCRSPEGREDEAGFHFCETEETSTPTSLHNRIVSHAMNGVRPSGIAHEADKAL